MVNRSKDRAESKTAAPPPEDGKFSLISNRKLIALYTNLLKCRRTALQGSNGEYATMRGREAVVVGTAIDLGLGDVVCSREHGLLAGFADGETIEKLLLMRNGHSPLPGGTEHAIGAALTNKTRKNGKVAVVYAEEQEPMRDALHVATIHSLPMIFVHQPNARREKPGLGRRSSMENSAEEETPWFPSITVDGNDVVAVYRVANEAISRARLGRGPTLIECRPFQVNGKPGRNGGHSHDPIRNMEHYLRARGLFDPKLKNAGTAFETQ